jgi:hypothetical protein
MSEAVPLKTSKAGKRWLDIAKRILVAVIIFIAAVGLIANVAGLVGVWSARAPASSAVTDVAAKMTHAPDTVDTGLAHVNNQVQAARQIRTQVNDAAAKLGNRIEASSPLVTGLSQQVDNNLAPRIENVRMTSVAVHDAVVNVNSALAVLNRIPGVSMPALPDELGSVSVHAQEAQTDVQDLRVTLAGMKAGLVARGEAAVTELTTSIDAALARIQAIVNKYQATVTSMLARISTTSNTLHLLINVLTVALTILFVIFAVGLVLLVYAYWKYVRTGRFPSLRVESSS